MIHRYIYSKDSQGAGNHFIQKHVIFMLEGKRTKKGGLEHFRPSQDRMRPHYTAFGGCGMPTYNACESTGLCKCGYM